ncbi:MAG: hypothetical protein KatS3mg115_0160 [Candidatus Poribacteria bacterium]|nr:MAG: hypothetical protein KatS3mg115_0160 [Candidatus Poribacteria bacterium]
MDRFPNDPDAGLWQYQVGEAYFAAQMYQQALDAYRQVIVRYPNHSSAPDALYSIAACYGYLGQVDQVFATYRELAEKYPDSQYAAEAFISVGDQLYNESIGLEGDAQIAKLKEALSYYQRVLELENAGEQARATARQYIHDTAELLASLVYTQIETRFNEALRNEDTAGIQQAIQDFEQLIRDYPTSSSADIALTKIGDGYVALEQWDQALEAYNRLMTKYVDPNTGRPITPGDEYVDRALRYAQQQYAEIYAYVQQLQGQGQ